MKKNKYKIGIILGVFMMVVLAYILTGTVFGEDDENKTGDHASEIRRETEDYEQEAGLEEKNTDDDIKDEKNDVESRIENEKNKMEKRIKEKKRKTKERAEKLQEKAGEYENKKKDNDNVSDVEVEIEPKNVIDDKVREVGLRVKTKKSVKKVEYYIDDNEEDIYLGRAKEEYLKNDDENNNESGVDEKNKEEKEWKLNIDQENRLPNGEYDVYAKIHTDNGEKESKRVKIRVEKKYIDLEKQQEKLKEKFGELSPNVDSDNDGVSDADEKRLGTNPYLADTDNDGYIDGDEINNGFDPLKASEGNKSDKVVFESPKDKGVVRNEYKVEDVKMEKDGDENKILLKGKALPNTFVRVYIYSNNPIIVTVRTDNDGNWSYKLDKELKNGEHEVYVAITDNTGKITSKSKPLAFVKTAKAVSVIPVANAKTTESPVETMTQYNIVYGIIIVIAVFSVALIIIKLLLTHK